MLLRDTQVFTPNDFPEHTYVERADDRLEEKLRNALSIPKQPISISGPSKSGKTALVERVIGPDNMIKVSGVEIRTANDLWERVLDWMDSPSSTVVADTLSQSAQERVSASASFGPGTSVTGEISAQAGIAKTTTESRARSGLPQVSREIGKSDYIVFLDDFHYIQSDLQEQVAREIKAAAERDIKICIASVPHRSDDVVRGNHELRGRTLNIDTQFWNPQDLEKIAALGFAKLNVELQESDVHALAEQACGSPQLMQSICLDACRKLGVRQTAIGVRRISISPGDLREILENTSMRTDYSSLVRDLHQGPRTKGQPRHKFTFGDQTTGDVYRCVLLALRRDPPHFQIPYAELIERVNAVCISNAPISGSIQNACRQMTSIAREHSPANRILEWDDRTGSGTFSIVDPYFLFFLRHSNKLQDLMGS
ncbi:MAG: hypothetical protein J0I21_18205 [Alphaproteobacteria bacterium]|nr:hypothetical protein [Alphaproteobacteria bacterium]